MESMDNLQTFSELSIALVGFAAIVTAIRGGTETKSRLRRIQMTGVFSFGLVGILFALLPQVLFLANLEEHTIWRYTSAALFLTNIGAAAGRWRKLKKIGSSVFDSGYAIHVPVNLIWISSAANVFMATAWLHMLALSCLLTGGMILFGTLLYLDDTDSH